MTFNRFDVCEAFYWFATTCHSGQDSKEYKIFGRLERIGFKPAPHIEHGKLEQGAAVIYHELTKSHRPDGYMSCSCRDCFELTVDSAFCDACSEHECGLNQECKCEPEPESEVIECAECDGFGFFIEAAVHTEKGSVELKTRCDCCNGTGHVTRLV